MALSLRTHVRARRLVTTAAHERGYRLRRPVIPLARDFDDDAVATIRAVSEYTQTTPERIVALRDAVAHVVQAGVPGAIVECGVWRGGSMMAVARELRHRGDTARDLWLYDTYAGMTEPTAADVTVTGFTGTAWLHDERSRPEAGTTGVTGVGVDEVRRNLQSTGYPADHMRFVVGPVEKTLMSTAIPDRIALLRLDTDFYASTRVELEVLWPLLAPGGVLLLDDYGYWLGAKQAVDEYFAESPVLLTRIDNSARLVVKVA